MLVSPERAGDDAGQAGVLQGKMQRALKRNPPMWRRSRMAEGGAVGTTSGDNPFFSPHPPNFIAHLISQSHVCLQQPSPEPKATAEQGEDSFYPLMPPAHIL